MPDRWDWTLERDRLAEAVDELDLIWPALLEATERDRGTSSGERVATSPILTVPVNVDVLAALDVLATDLGGLGDLYRLAGCYDDLASGGREAAARRLVAAVRGCRATARRAIGLSVPDRPLGQYCPRHDEPLTELVAPGDQGQLCYRGRDERGHPVGLSVVWHHQDVVACPWRPCGARWTPSQQMFLARLLREADARRVTERGGTSEPGAERMVS